MRKKCCLTKGLNLEPSVPIATLITTRPWESVHDTKIKFKTFCTLMYLLLIDKKAPARVVKLFLRSCRIGLRPCSTLSLCPGKT